MHRSEIPETLRVRLKAGTVIPAHPLALDGQITDCNAAFFDVANDFRGCIAGNRSHSARPVRYSLGTLARKD